MSTSTHVPVVVSPEAAARVAELGMQAEYEQMLEHMRQTTPGLQRIEVRLVEPYDTGTDPGIVLEAWSSQSYDPNSDALAQQAITDVTDALTLLDAIEADPARRSAAIASITP